MKETLYMNEQMAILNFSASYARTAAELLNSPTFKNLVESFIDDLETTDPELYAWAVNGKSTRQAKVEITKLFRELTILECDEVESYYLMIRLYCLISLKNCIISGNVISVFQ